MKKILVIGCRGQVGWELTRTLATVGHVIACDRGQCDLTHPQQFVKLIRDCKPELIINAAAYTAVDRAESEADLAMLINAVAPGILAEEAQKLNAILVYFSTDYVFDGTASLPYSESDQPNPLNIYGQSKWCGEQNIQAVGGNSIILRTSWVYGLRGHNFLLTMLKLAQQKSELKVVNDQQGAPTWSRWLAEMTAQMAALLLQQKVFVDKPWGIYHATPQGSTSWYGFAKVIFSSPYIKTLQAIPKITPLSSSDYPSIARRPRNSLLTSDKLYRTFGLRMPDWDIALQQCLESWNS